jgi:hypothetical protein
MYILDVKSKEDLNEFFKENNKHNLNPLKYPKEYPCKIVVYVDEDSYHVSYEFVYNEKNDSVKDFKINQNYPY